MSVKKSKSSINHVKNQLLPGLASKRLAAIHPLMFEGIAALLSAVGHAGSIAVLISRNSDQDLARPGFIPPRTTQLP